MKGTPEVRFWSKVNTSSDCWEWKGYVNKGTGYGQFNAGGTKRVSAHRFAYEDKVGPIPEGLVIDHKCHNRLCVNPGHLRAVTRKQNNENHAGPNSDNRHGARGIWFDRSTGKYRAAAMHNGRSHSKSGFDSVEDAAEAARLLRLSLHTHNDVDRMAG